MQEYLTLPELHDQIGKGRSRRAFKTWLDREEKAGRFPARVRLSARCLVWPEPPVEAWLDRLPRGAGHEAA